MIYFYSSDYTKRYPITDIIAITEKIYYNDTGSISLTLAMTDYNLKNTQQGGLVYRYETGDLFEIQQVKCDVDENEITVNCSTADDLLRKRIVPVALAITNVETGIYSLVNANLRGYANIQTAASKGLTGAVTSTNCYGKDVITLIEPILTAVDYGRRMIWDDKTRMMTFEVYQGRDLTSGIHKVIFAEERGTASDLTTDENTLNWFNYCYVEATDSSQVVHIVEAGSATGNDRHEMWTTFSGQAQQSGETTDAFLARVKQFGELQIEKYSKGQSFSVNIDTKDYGDKYRMGDKITCISLKLGKSYDARITGMKYTMDAQSGENTVVTLGTPRITKLELRRS
jgi:hypothetical protein